MSTVADERQGLLTGKLLAIGARVQLRGEGGAGFELTGKAAALVALAALDGQVERRRAALMLWPDSPEGQARNNLRTLAHRVNQRFGGELLKGTERLAIDAAQVRVVLQDSQALLSALRSGGPQACELLAAAGIQAETSALLADWLDAARQRLRRLQLTELSAALTQARARQDAGQAIALARACVQLEPLSEHWHRQLMDTLAGCGDRAAALAAYEDCKALLRQQLGVLPDLQTRTVQLRILQGQAQMAEAPQAVAAGLTPLGGAARFPLVEREAVLAEVRQALAQGQHVAVQGEAGVGKTRLLRQLAEQGQVEQLAIPPGAREESYAAVMQLLQELQPRHALKVGVPEQVELARLAPLAFPEVQPSQASLSRPRLHAALRHWLDQLARAGVQTLVVDDLHHADAASQAAFAALLAPGDDGAATRPTLLLAHRSGETGPSWQEALVSAQVRGQARSIALPRLTQRGVQALLQAMQAERGEEQAARLLQRTGGNPLFVIELARHALEKSDEPVPAAANLDVLLRSRLAGCSAEAQQLAAVAGVAGQDFSVELATAVTGRPALALMSAWSELQQKGLFADHGLAHDLVREAALAGLPQAIGRTLHRQVAAHLEGLGLKGARVLGHWLAAQEFDPALPHLMHQLYATSAAGLSTVQLEIELLGLMAGLSDAVLIDKLWLTAEVDDVEREDLVLRTHGPRLEALVQRVERGPRTEAVDAWLAYERARLLSLRDRQAAKAYATLREAAERMPEQGIERAYVEVFLSVTALNVTGEVRAHATRARAALAGLGDQPEHARLRKLIDTLSAFRSSVTDLLRAKLALLRAARGRQDLGAVEGARFAIGRLCTVRGLASSAYRYFRLNERAQLPAERLREEGDLLISFSAAALLVGRYTAALRFLDPANLPPDLAVGVLFRAVVWLQLGQWDLAATQARSVTMRDVEGDLAFLNLYAVLRADLDLQQGVDPLPISREIVARAQELGVEGPKRQLLEWEVILRTQDPRERAAIGTRMLQDMKTSQVTARRLPRLLVEVAEAHAQAGLAAARSLAMEAARELRRGRGPVTLYLPEGLVRCARLLQASDPAEAAALMHVAQRWVLQALPHVPEFARRSFVEEVAVNRLLLAEQA